jgi:opacity protein-like surface antigen
MRNVFRSLLAGAAVVAAGATAASAADLGRGHGSLKDYGAPMPVTMSSPSSWYIRGDFSASSFDVPTIYESFNDATAPAEYDLTQTKIGNNWGLGGGIGRYLGANTRADITFDWLRKSSVSGFMSPITNDAPVGGCIAVGDCAVNLPGTHKFDLQSTVGLLNFYYDFGQRGHFSPYVGAGIGFVRHKTSNGTINGHFPSPGGPAFDNVVSGTIDGKSTTQLAGALMTGFSVALRSNMHLDAGYRFLYMGKAETGAVRGSSTDIAAINAGGGVMADPNYNDPTVTDIHAHQFRVGVRYDFGAGSCGQRC